MDEAHGARGGASASAPVNGVPDKNAVQMSIL